MRFFIYGNSGGIDKVKEELNNPKETFSNIHNKDDEEKLQESSLRDGNQSQRVANPEQSRKDSDSERRLN